MTTTASAGLDLLLARTAYAREALCALPGVVPLHAQPVVREFAVRLPVDGLAGVRAVIDRCQAAGVNPGYALGRDSSDWADGLLVALTERRTRADIDRLVAVLADALLAESVAPGASVAAGTPA